jgi:hypothetical protein
MFKRIRKAWELSKDETLIPKKKSKPVGVFFGTGTTEEHVEFEREQKGLDKWYKRILR